MDQVIKGITEQSRIRVTVADVTVSAKALEARHLSGPVASALLGEALACVALLAADASRDDEAWMLRLNVSGPIGGLLVEATGGGKLRGFTNRKVMDELDGISPVSTDAALGESGNVQIVSTLPGRILNQAVLQVNPPQLRYVLGRYYNQSMQTPTGCNVWVVADDGGLLSARALLVQRMVDSDQDVFIRMLEQLEQGAADELMRQRTWSGQGLSVLGEKLACDPIVVREQRSYAFGCRCNKDRVIGALAVLSVEELDELIETGKTQDVTCHMCGHTYSADTADLRKVREAVVNRPTP